MTFFLSPHFYDVDALLIIESGQGYNSLPIKSNQHSYVMSPFHQDCFGPDSTDPFLVDRPHFCKKIVRYLAASTVEHCPLPSVEDLVRSPQSSEGRLPKK